MTTIHMSQALNSKLYHDALTIRKQVFIEEQGVDPKIEIDDFESLCFHFCLYQNNQALATCRLYPLNQEEIKIQRVAVTKNARHLGYGQALMEACLKFAKDRHYSNCILDAQEIAIPFYLKLGFKIESDIFLEAGIKHRKMAYTLR
ncbi:MULTISPECIES: GNAT family N-acetyltransferase [Aerococcus]|uniref:GNAT family N-acetyltransferase n=2 Tax=Aerococcus TaxID=1375 RepID=A0A178HG91_9LACT|nr:MULTISPECIES: GNAT family N-acetyltransferase [Aerococcus]KAA9220120.1 GNAT family N-acetyltransferase [Aerococcus loyolae]KAA9266356.1 GNAT family N-acetyltransferase [Aerococcus loyolae]MCY3025146.1 GNAT family N-acetyltransferase [Aerococcus loyolae]MCY3027198.1 GNAT family N-acetyltransferase [Aerococcus loyolae]MCY3029237.1 GNAT family N-acetyltransferase [Aerococcus loyolae]